MLRCGMHVLHPSDRCLLWYMVPWCTHKYKLCYLEAGMRKVYPLRSSCFRFPVNDSLLSGSWNPVWSVHMDAVPDPDHLLWNAVQTLLPYRLLRLPLHSLQMVWLRWSILLRLRYRYPVYPDTDRTFRIRCCYIFQPLRNLLCPT